MKAFSKSRGWFFEVDFGGQTICSLLKLGLCFVGILGWLPWQSQLPTSTASARCGFHRLCCWLIANTTLDIRTHILSSLRCDLGKMYFKSFIVLTFTHTLLSSAVEWASLGYFYLVATYSDITREAGTVHLITLNPTMITLYVPRVADSIWMLHACCGHSPLLPPITHPSRRWAGKRTKPFFPAAE
jgi:hypothetical protein